MPEQREVPAELTVVAVLFLIFGVHEAIEMALEFSREGDLTVPIGLLGFWIFFGLRAFSPGWRTCALVILWLSLIGMVGGQISRLFHGAPLTIGRLPEPWAYAIVIAFIAVIAWQLRVLTRPDIRALFFRPVPATA